VILDAGQPEYERHYLIYHIRVNTAALTVAPAHYLLNNTILTAKNGEKRGVPRQPDRTFYKGQSYFGSSS
jgi:hypothetical protein